MKTIILVAFISLTTGVAGTAAADEITKESVALSRAVRVAKVAPRPITTVKVVPIGCSARTLFNSTFQTVTVCR